MQNFDSRIEQLATRHYFYPELLTAHQPQPYSSFFVQVEGDGV